MAMDAILARSDAIDPDKTVINGNLIYYPTIKLRVGRGGQQELDSSSFSLAIDHDPLIRSDTLLVLPPDSERQMLRRIPALADQADKPVPFRSAEATRVASILFTYVIDHEVADVVLATTGEHLRIIETLLARLDPALPKGGIRAFLLDAIVQYFALVDISAVDPTWQSPGAGGAQRMRLLMPEEVVRDFFGLDDTDGAPEGGQVVIAVRELGQ
ncbi:hypothetical protein BXU08_06005 [Sphingomonas sp. LM7]|nr:hypothetical protein BXU08_06005 [Sphingomonas sp. LM7]